MPLWCDPSDVQALFAGIQGSNFDASEFQPKIEDARDTMITEFAGKYSKDTLDLWDADIANVPPTIKKGLCFLVK